MRVTCIHKVTREEFTGWVDDDGSLWIDDPSCPGYAWDPSDWITR